MIVKEVLKDDFITEVRNHDGLFIPVYGVIDIVIPVAEVLGSAQRIQDLETPDAGVPFLVFPVIDGQVQVINSWFLFFKSS